ncbi:MAG: uroporphyrinogen-III synthase [Marinilabiliaceae bacterium]|nr:uroporphyrinogen-III synthase [Marinilabiliaceae bacterium]
MTTLFTGLTPPDDECIHTPLIEIVPPADGEALRCAVADAAKFDYILFTSRYAVKYWFEVDYEPHIPAGVNVVAIGKTTAEALKKFCIADVIMPDVDDSYGVIRLFEQLGGGRKVLIPRSSIALPIIPEGLRNLGYEVSTVVAYINQMPENVRKVNLDTIDRIVFTSPSTVDNFLRLYGSLPSNKELVTRGSITQERLNYHINNINIYTE